ncbi:mitochondrial 2-enoyl thioester reductase [Coemansia spiralis]|nr:mitochondrial 2-enoyl thioester reductase [Coemansia spiralis]
MLLRCRPVLRSPAFCCRRALTAQAAIYTETGNPQDVVRVVEREVPDSADGLEPGQVVVRMLAAPVNPSDLNQIEGTYPVRGRFAAMALRGGAEVTGAVGGNEGVGEVVAVATRGADGVQLGDWVVPRRAGEFGTWCTHTVAAASGLHVVPRAWREGVRAADVACLKVNPSTAYRMLRDFAELRAGDYVIQNGANSGVGRAVIQLARHWGIRTINVVRDRPQLAALQRELQELGADIVVTDRQLGDEGVKRQLRSLGAPVRLGFNCVGGRATLQMTKHISAGGTLVSYGGMSRQPVTLPTSLLLFRDLRARGFWMNRWYAGCEGDPAREAAMMAMWQDILRLVRDDSASRQLRRIETRPAAESQTMVELSVQFDQEGCQFLAYKQRESRLQGRLVVKTKDKLKVRQISIRLVSTELVDFHASGPADGSAGKSSSTAQGGEYGTALHSYVQKSSRTIGTWAILEKGSSAHMLKAGEHRYSFELALPRGLDGSIATRPYTLHYELETRVEHSFKLKPDSTQLTPVELVQVPMALNLHADDRISLAAGPRPAPTGALLVADDVPMGQALLLAPDMIDQKEPFVLHHLWDDALSLRLRLPHGRAFPAGSNPVLDVEAVPIVRNYRCTRFTVALEEITIVARPQRASAVRTGTSGNGGSSSAVDTPPPRRQSAAASHLSSSSEDSLPVSSSHNAWAYAQASSAEYRNAITKVRELGRTTAPWPRAQFDSLTSYHGILVAKRNLSIPAAGQDSTHADIRNSHVQIHHQLVYELEYQAINTEEMAVPLQKEPRIMAAAHVYRSLGNANIARRDRLPGGVGAALHRPMTVRGTLPVALVSRRIADLWAIRDLSRDPATEDSPVAAAANGHLSHGASPYPPVLSVPEVRMPAMSDSECHSSSTGPSRASSVARAHSPMIGFAPAPAYGMPTPGDFGPATSRPAGMYPPQPSDVYPPQPAGLYPYQSPGLYPPQPAGVYPPGPPGAYPPAQASAYPPLPSDPNALAAPGAGGSQQLQAGGMAFDPSLFQRQIEVFQQQQRQQQEQFFQQLTEQYAQMTTTGQAPSNAMLGPGAPNDPARTHDGRPLSMASTLCPTDIPPGSAGGAAAGPSSAADIYAVLDRPLVPVSPAPAPAPPAAPRTNTVESSISQSSDRQSVHTAEEEPDAQPLQARPVEEPAEHSSSGSGSGRESTGPAPEIAATTVAVEPPAEAPAVEPTEATPLPARPSERDAEAARPAAASATAPPAAEPAPPPSYDDLLPPEYEIPGNAPPPYQPTHRR